MIDTILNERYLILKSLGKGGFSETFLAQDDLSSSLRVVKGLKLSSTPSETAQELFETEVQTLYQLGHLNQQIPALFDHFVQDQSLYLVQEFIDGHDLAQETEKDQTWNQTKIIELLRQVLPTLQFLHSHQVIHGDIKPRNIIRGKDGRLVLIDFGAVKLASSQSSSSPQSSSSSQSAIVGTAGYMPNEQQAGRSRFSSDIYALGMVVIQCITGIHPRDLKEDSKTGEIQWKSQVKIHPQLTKIIGKMVKVCLRERYTSAAAVLIDLDRFEQGQASKQTNKQLPTQIMYGSVIFLLLLGGLIGVQRSPLPRSSSHSPIALQIIGISIPITTLTALIRLRLW